MRLALSQSSFIPYTTNLWNKLPLAIRQSPTLNTFKNQIFPKVLTSNYNKLCSGYYGRLLTRLRLGLSGLNAHRFKYNLHNTPICPSCLLAPEDNFHFFFLCPTHQMARQHFLNLLQSELDLDTTNKKQTLDIILHGNINPNKQPPLLKFIYQYIELTGRFKQ